MRQYCTPQKFLHLYHSYVSHSAGIEIVTYPNKYQTSAVVGGSADAQASSKDVSALLGRLDTTRAQSESTANPRNMDTEKRNNSTIVKKNMESEAATKIQASFRGYQVRKQLKNKVSKFCFLARDNITNIKRTTRRKSLGRIADAKSVNRQSDLEEQSATKIQAGIRGFLVRRRQKKTKPNSE
ncbi:iq calmodulin-binding motif [Holotrichia oblita]|uniref:Iq calmodulin-binding motif n=1 Tax=Holotrichia oblita TaxID=644536 RepID=A0ACB9TPA7_HOLOL|nr:iq calmodulin-binding motif [Holotrichia oblita]